MILDIRRTSRLCISSIPPCSLKRCWSSSNQSSGMFRLQLQPGKYTVHAVLMVHSGPILFLFIRTLTGWASHLSVSAAVSSLAGKSTMWAMWASCRTWWSATSCLFQARSKSKYLSFWFARKDVQTWHTCSRDSASHQGREWNTPGLPHK